MRWLLWLLLLVPVWAEDVRTEVLARDAEYMQARIRMDEPALQSLLDAEFTVVRDNGEVLDRAAFFRTHLAHVMQKFEHEDDPIVTVAGDIVIVIGRHRVAGRDAAGAFQAGSVASRVWVRRQGKWLLLHHHFHRLKR